MVNIELVKCEEKYWEFVRELRNHPKNVYGFFSKEYVNKETHWNFMEKYHEWYNVGLVGGGPVGWVGVVKNDLRVCTHPDWHGMGIAKQMLKKFIENIQDKQKLTVVIDEVNVPSQRAFMAVGFKEISRYVN